MTNLLVLLNKSQVKLISDWKNYHKNFNQIYLKYFFVDYKGSWMERAVVIFQFVKCHFLRFHVNLINFLFDESTNILHHFEQDTHGK